MGKSATLHITGVDRASCATHIEQIVGGLAGVECSFFDLAGEQLLVSYREPATAHDIIYRIEAAGYGVAMVYTHNQPEPFRRREEKHLVWQLTLSAICCILPLLAMMLGVAGAENGFAAVICNTRLLIIPAILVQCLVGHRFYAAAWRALRSGGVRMMAYAPPAAQNHAPKAIDTADPRSTRTTAGTGMNMDVLVALCTTAAFALGIYSGFAGPRDAIPGQAAGLYFGASAILITLSLLGKYLERGTRGRAMAAAIDPDVKISGLEQSDSISRPGRGGPTAGTTVAVDSVEAAPVYSAAKRPVDIDSGYSAVDAANNHSGAHTPPAEPVRDVAAPGPPSPEGGAAGFSPLHGADRIAALYVPAIIAAAIATLAGWWLYGGDCQRALVNAASVLVIACPGALGIACPIACKAGIGRGAGSGILFDSGEYLAHTASITAVVLNKTGTITDGRLDITDILSVGGANVAEMLALVGSAEAYSEQPLGAAIHAYVCRRMGALPAPDSFAPVAGRGIAAQVEGRRVLIGTRKLMREAGVDISAREGGLARLENEGKTAMLVAVDGVFSAVIAVADTVRDGASSAVAELHAMGVRVYMVTGDNPRTAKAIGRRVGIDGGRVFPELLPREKAREVARLRFAGHTVAMVGEGADADPALSTANVGFAMGAGAVTEGTGVTLLPGDLGSVPAAIRLARRTVRKIRQNLFWAIVFHVIGIPLAALGLLSPLVYLAVTALSAASVLANALGLRRFAPMDTGRGRRGTR